MTRDDVKKLFPEATDEQINGLLNIHSADIGRAKAAGAADSEALKAAQKELEDAKASIQALEKAKGSAEDLQKEIDRYKAAEAEREEAARKAAAHEELTKRFDAAAGDRKFVHQYVHDGVMNEFEKAIASPDNQGKGDKAIFDSLTKDKDYFQSMNPGGADMGGAGSSGDIDDARVRAIMGLPAK